MMKLRAKSSNFEFLFVYYITELEPKSEDRCKRNLGFDEKAVCMSNAFNVNEGNNMSYLSFGYKCISNHLTMEKLLNFLAESNHI